jgi:hypothetical protein
VIIIFFHKLNCQYCSLQNEAGWHRQFLFLVNKLENRLVDNPRSTNWVCYKQDMFFLLLYPMYMEPRKNMQLF